MPSPKSLEFTVRVVSHSLSEWFLGYNNAHMNIGIIGAGGIANAHKNWQHVPGATIVAVADIVETKAQKLAGQFGARVYPSAEALLSQSDVRVDIVSVCTPTPTHRQITALALQSQKHVFCEKPMALTLNDCDAMIAAQKNTVAQKATEKLLSIGQVVRFFGEYENAKRLVDAGKVGKPAVVRVRRGGGFPTWGEGDWFNDFAQSGGVIFDLLVHEIDFLQWTFGPIVRVYAQGTTLRNLDHQDYALLTMRHENGVVSHAEGVWVHDAPGYNSLEIAGDAGLFVHDSRKASPLTGKASSSPRHTRDDPFFKELLAFAKAIKGEATLAVTPEEARANIQVAVAAYESLTTGKVVTL
jgi:UDP-N-acetylglucosamine 3-dehydrogenase